MKNVTVMNDFLILEVTAGRCKVRLMHEYSLTQNILDLSLQHAEGKKIMQVNLLIGEFSDEREEAIQFYWNDLAKGTCAEAAQLYFQKVDAVMKCLECENIFHPLDEYGFCPQCNSHRLELLEGDDVKLSSIDVE